MRYSAFALAALVGSALSVFVACATSDEGPSNASDTNVTQPPTSNDSKVPPAPSNTGSSSSTSSSGTPAKTCVSKCTADTECQNSCPVQQNTIYCCDTKTGTCYGAKQTVCPQPEEDSGTPPPAY